jgi:hypothetical protein
MSTCPACKKAETNPQTGHYVALCRNCEARALAQSPFFSDAIASNTITPGYRIALRTVFAGDWKDGHEAVKRWHDRITRARTHLEETK